MSGQPRPEVFTKAFKVKGSIVTSGLTLLMFVVPFGGGLLLTWWVGRHYGHAAGWLTFLGVLALCFATNYLAHQTVFLYGNARVRRDLAAAIERRTGHNPDDGRSWFVGWAPGRSLNPKEGDTVHFELHRTQVVSVNAKVEGVPFLFDFGYRACVEWLDQYGQTNAFTLERREGRHRRQVRRNTRQLAEILQHWQHTGAVPQ
jgi:hypothetical protein